MAKQNKARLDLFDPWTQQTVWPTRKFDAGARLSLVGQEAIGVMEPDGHFVLVELSDGRTLADLKLDAEAAMADILVVHSGQQYLLLTTAAVPPRTERLGLQAIGSVMTAYPIRKGRMVSFDEKGKLLWPAAVNLEDQMFLIGQPETAPVVVFASQRVANGNSGFSASISDPAASYTARSRNRVGPFRWRSSWPRIRRPWNSALRQSASALGSKTQTRR